MPTLPPPPAIKLTPAEAAAIAKRGRKLMRAGRITHCQWAVLDCLLWSCRSPATGAIVVSPSYSPYRPGAPLLRIDNQYAHAPPLLAGPRFRSYL